GSDALHLATGPNLQVQFDAARQIWIRGEAPVVTGANARGHAGHHGTGVGNTPAHVRTAEGRLALGSFDRRRLAAGLLDRLALRADVLETVAGLTDGDGASRGVQVQATGTARGNTAAALGGA